MDFAEGEYDEEEDVVRCPLWEAIGADWLDHDFIETIVGDFRFDYVKNFLADSAEIETIKQNCLQDHNTFFIIYVDDYNTSFQPSPTNNPRYIGTFQGKLS